MQLALEFLPSGDVLDVCVLCAFPGKRKFFMFDMSWRIAFCTCKTGPSAILKLFNFSEFVTKILNYK